MSEYWKSTPKYWCKFCKAFVRDTKFERQQHEATLKHQGAIQRSLRDLHRSTEREERDKQRARDEVARLNGVVGGGPGSAAQAGSSGAAEQPWRRKAAAATGPSAQKQATPEERKRQLQQLADMGVAVPEEFRRDLAMAGDWQVLSETPVAGALKEEEDVDVKPESRAIGVRKRKLEGDEEEEAGETVMRKGWGSTFKTYLGARDEESDLEALLSAAPAKGRDAAPADGELKIKKEDSVDEGVLTPDPDPDPDPADRVVKTEEAATAEEGVPGAGVVFKKRKGKNVARK